MVAYECSYHKMKTLSSFHVKMRQLTAVFASIMLQNEDILKLLLEWAPSDTSICINNASKRLNLKVNGSIGIHMNTAIRK